MPYDGELIERLRRMLSSRTGVIERGMIGGVCFLVNGKMCCGVNATGLMVRVGSGVREQKLTERYVQPMIFAGRPLSGFVLISPAGYRTDKALAKWVQCGLDFVESLPGKKTAAKSRPEVG